MGDSNGLAGNGDEPSAAASRSGGRWRRPAAVVAALVAALLLGGAVGSTIVSATRSSATGSPAASTSTAGSSATRSVVAAACSATEVARRGLPAVVTISATDGKGTATGSGETIRADGYILTNNHVVAPAAGPGGRLSVLFNDGRSAPATIAGRDPKADLAVIKVDAPSALPVIPFGRSRDIVVGQPVVALGAPLGLSNTVTTGIISARDRTIEVPGDDGQTALLVSAVQTDAAINPGNSGGALLDCDARLIGVPSAGASIPDPSGTGGGSSGSIGLGFAIPADVAKSVSDEIIATGTVTHAYFGLSAVSIPRSPDQQGGAYVQGVLPGGPAASAGLAPGDVVTSIDGAPVTGTTDLAAVTLTRDPGDTVTVGYHRDGAARTTELTLGAQP